MDVFPLQLDALLQTSMFAALAAAFAGGVLASLTPCIYPMIPITAGVVPPAVITAATPANTANVTIRSNRDAGYRANPRQSRVQTLRPAPPGRARIVHHGVARACSPRN